VPDRAEPERAEPERAEPATTGPDPVGSGQSAGPERYRERLNVPVAWWVLSGLFAISMLLAFGLYLGPWWGIGTAGVSFGAMAAVFGAASTVISVTEDELRVGRANIALRYLGEIKPLDAAAARRRRGPEADARAFLVLRPYVSSAVEVHLTDVDDPAPYWLVASRRPRAFAAALAAVVPAHHEPSV
jgi:hypothetical protein